MVDGDQGPGSFYGDYVARLPEGIDAVSEPFGWYCTRCDGTFAHGESVPPSGADGDRIVEMLIDSAQWHQRAVCPLQPESG